MNPTDVYDDPQFVSPDLLNFHLRMYSPCRDAGDPASGYGDLDTTRNDIGADGGPHGVEDTLAPMPVLIAEPLEGNAPLTVSFDGTAPRDEWGLVTYSWDFDGADGVGEDALGPIAEMTYQEAGTYAARLTVVDNNGIAASTVIDIRVSDPPVASASADPIVGPVPLPVQFSATGVDPDGGPVTYSWDFDNDGLADSAEQSPFHTYDDGVKPGRHIVVLTVTDDEQALTQVRVYLTITEEEPDASAQVSPTEGGTISVNNADASTYGVTVTVSEGAMPEPTVIAISPLVNAPPLDPVHFGPMLQLGPTGTQFSQPVTVRVPHPATLPHPEPLEVYCYDTTSGCWSKAGISNVRHVTDTPNHFVEFETDHFTTFAVTPMLKATDVNLDGAVNAVDVQLVINGALGLR